MSIDDRLWRIQQKRLKYTDEEMKIFRENPRNLKIFAKSAEVKDKLIILEVVEAHGCSSGYKAGDRFYFDYAGNLLTKMCPARVCGYSLNAALMLVYAANEMLFADVDPNQMMFKRASCFDVGLECGGWGRIVLELKVEDKSRP